MIRIRCFGGISVEGTDGRAIHFRSRKHVALLSFLAANRDRVYGRDELVRLLWDSPLSSARHSLSQALYDLKRRLGEFSTQRFGDGLRLASDIEFEGRQFEEAVKRDDLRRAVDLYRGDFAAAYDRVGTEAFESWIDDERRRYRILAQAALHRYVELCDGQGDWGQMCVAAVKLVGINPISEKAHRSLMRALWLHGDQASALRHFGEIEDQLSSDLPGGISLETQALVQRIRSSAPPAPAGINRAEPPIVGREQEFACLRELVDSACRSEGVLAVVRGEAGVGKTRLSAELARCAAVEGVRVLKSRCYAAEENVAYGPVLDALREFSDLICSKEGAEGPLYPHIRQLLRCAASLDTSVDLEADLAGERRRLYEEIAGLTSTLCEDATTVWIFDDVQWIDGSSASLLSYLIRRLADRRFLLLVTVRDPSDQSEACRKLLRDRSTDQQARTLSLGPLSLGAVRSLIERLEVATTTDLPERIHRLSGGNAFLALELLRDAGPLTTLEAEDLAGELLQSDRVRSLLKTRLQGLAPSSIRLLEAISVLGRNATPAHAADAAGLTLPAASDVSEELYARGILRDVEEQLEFAHDITREFVYQNLGGVRRASLHLFVAEALARDVQVTLPTIARHFHLGGDRARAFEYGIRAAKASIASFGHEEAKSMASLALSQAVTNGERATSLGILGRAEFAVGSMQQAENHLTRLLDIELETTPVDRATTRLLIARARMERSDRAGAARALEELSHTIPTISEPAQQVDIEIERHVLALKLATRWHDPVLARQTAEAIRTLYSESRTITHEAATTALYGLAAFAAFFESVDEAASLINEAETRARCDTPELLQRTLLLAGLVEARRARWERAESLLSEALSSALRRNHVLDAGIARNSLAYCAVERGLWDRAHQLCSESLQTYATLPEGTFVRTAPLTNLADALLYQGRPREAKVVYERALGHVSDDYVWQLRASLALVALQLGERHDARFHWKAIRNIDSESLTGVQERFKVEWLRAFAVAQTGVLHQERKCTDVTAHLRRLDLPGSLKLSWLNLLLFGQAGGNDEKTILADLRGAGMGWFAPFSRRWHAAATANSDPGALEV
jgi:DNA-binding SARP family transcriptional activator/tetratricopeptide (TPR) repeat protein